MGLKSLSTASLLTLALASALALAAPRKTPAAVEDGRPPNIVLILIDDMSWFDPGCYGNPFHETPHIDRLARQGMRFTGAYAAAPVCSPTRASILTGKHPARLGITDFIPGHQRPWARLRVPQNGPFLPLEEVTYAEALAPRGYRAGYFGKWHLGGPNEGPEEQGFDDAVVTSGSHFRFRTDPPREIPEGIYLADFLTQEAERFIESHRDRPFMLQVSHYAVHIPLEAKQAAVEKYERKPRGKETIDHPTYAAMVEHVDESVGRILRKLEELELTQQTAVIFTSDNGGLYRRYDGKGPVVTTNGALRDEKGSLYEGGIRVPFIVRWPGVVEAGSTSSVPVSSVDIFPTFLGIAGGEVEGGVVDGRSLVPLLRGEEVPEKAIYWHYPHYHHSKPAGAVRAGRFKLIEFYEDGRLELFDLSRDPGERKDLAQAMPQKREELRARLEAWRRSVGAKMPEPNPDHDPDRAKEWGSSRRR